jgi:hypothetical protein
MYLFLVTLTASDLSLSLLTFPAMLRISWLDIKELTFSNYLNCVFFIQTF